ncbi:hypothetical protein MUP77_26075 [Candidatus Bathyarchaeota archaeon]|nr:hypothetical protein [Candidatus Bathyarchaeota archaeon]
MVIEELVVLVSVFVFAAHVIFLFRSLKRKKSSDGVTYTSLDATELDIKFLLLERDQMIPRLALVLTTNSILFLGYIQARLSIFGGIIAIFAIALNILYSIYFVTFAKYLDSLQKRVEPVIPIEYRKRTLKGRWGFVPLIMIFELIWVFSTFHSFLGWFI